MQNEILPFDNGKNKSEKTHYTVKEIADILKVDRSTIQRWVEKHYPEKMQQGKTTLLNQEEITVIKQEINRNPNLCNVAQVTTDLEMFQKTMDVFQWMREKMAAYEQQIENDKPKVEFFNSVADSLDCVDFGSFAKTTSIGVINLFRFLREKGIVFLHNGYNLPKQDYKDAGYFRVIEQTYKQKGETKIGFKTLITPKGQIWLSRFINRETKKELSRG